MPHDTAMSRQGILRPALSARRAGPSIRALAPQAVANARTIRRDLALFRRPGLPLDDLTGPSGRQTCRIASPAGQPPPAGTPL